MERLRGRGQNKGRRSEADVVSRNGFKAAWKEGETREEERNVRQGNKKRQKERNAMKGNKKRKRREGEPREGKKSEIFRECKFGFLLYSTLIVLSQFSSYWNDNELWRHYT